MTDTDKQEAPRPTELPANEWAIVTADNCTRMELLIPDGKDEDALTNVAMYLTACFARAYKEPEFATQMVEWLQAQKPEKQP